MLLKYIGYTDTVLFLPTGKAGDVVCGYYGYLLQISWVRRKPISIFIGCPAKYLLPTYLNFYGDIYPAKQGL